MILIAIQGVHTMPHEFNTRCDKNVLEQVDSPSTEDNTPDLVIRSVGGNTSSFARRLCSRAFDLTAYGLLLLTGAGLTPGTLKFFNRVLQEDCIRVAAKPSGNQREVELREEPVDSFLSNFEDSKLLIDAFKILEVDLSVFDMNKSGVILETTEEINYAKKILIQGLKGLSNSDQKDTVSKAIKFLNQYKLLSKKVWGDNGPDKNSISQNAEPNCQTMSAFKGLFLTDSSIQETRGRIKITSLDLSGRNPDISFEVFVSGKWTPVSFEELKIASCPEGYNASGSKDGSLFTALFKVAASKSSKDTVPNWWFSNSSTIFTNENYIPMFLLALSDNEMRTVFSNVPEKLVTVAGKFNLNDIKNGIALRKKNWNNPELSDVKAARFDADFIRTVVESDESQTADQLALAKRDTEVLDEEDVVQELEIFSSFPPSSPRGKSKTVSENQLLPANCVRNGHVYVVESFDPKSDTMIISDAHGDRVQLSGMDEIRSNLSGVICPEVSVGTFTGRTVPVYLILGSLGLIYFSVRKSMQRT